MSPDASLPLMIFATKKIQSVRPSSRQELMSCQAQDFSDYSNKTPSPSNTGIAEFLSDESDGTKSSIDVADDGCGRGRPYGAELDRLA